MVVNVVVFMHANVADNDAMYATSVYHVLRLCCREVAEAAGAANDPHEVSLWHGSPSLANFDKIVEQGFDIRVSNMGGALGAGTYFAADASYSDMYSRKAAPNAGAGLALMPGGGLGPAGGGGWGSIGGLYGMITGYGAAAGAPGIPPPPAAAGSSKGGKKSKGSKRGSGPGGQQQQQAGRHEWVGQYAMLMCRVSLGKIGLGTSNMRKPPEGFDSVSQSGRAKPAAGDIFAVYDNAQAYPEYIIHYDV